MDNIPIVNGLLDVFLDELSSLLPKREINFKIDLVSSTKSISKVSYQMTPVELKELNKQLQELLDQ